MALTNDILHPEEIPSGVIGTVEVDLNVERLSSAHNQLVVDVLVGVVVHLVTVPPLLEQVNTRDIKVVYTQRKQSGKTLSHFGLNTHSKKQGYFSWRRKVVGLLDKTLYRGLVDFRIGLLWRPCIQRRPLKSLFPFWPCFRSHFGDKRAVILAYRSRYRETRTWVKASRPSLTLVFMQSAASCNDYSVSTVEKAGNSRFQFCIFESGGIKSDKASKGCSEDKVDH